MKRNNITSNYIEQENMFKNYTFYHIMHYHHVKVVYEVVDVKTNAGPSAASVDISVAKQQNRFYTKKSRNFCNGCFIISSNFNFKKEASANIIDTLRK